MTVSAMKRQLLSEANILVAKPTTTVLAGTSSILPPGEVKPWHITFDPLSTNFTAPLSTCILGIMDGSAQESIDNRREPGQDRKTDKYACETTVGRMLDTIKRSAERWKRQSRGTYIHATVATLAPIADLGVERRVACRPALPPKHDSD